ncbi:DNA cytosine methyltransferase [Sphingomonas hankookensis]|uniref:DNA cytosine methyltransferase n=1 Tax=Sphingomonas hankookensis TaxID=563996 RepID=UPI003F7A620F
MSAAAALLRSRRTRWTPWAEARNPGCTGDVCPGFHHIGETVQLTFGSVCSGIEAASVAWEPFGWRAVWLAEVDKAASEVLAHRFPSVPNLGDMTLLAAMIRRREIPAPDVLVGGTPCQAFSVAGRRQGLADERGALTLAYIDLADAIDEVRAADCLPPCVIVWENVPGVLSSKDNAFGCFLAGLAGESEAIEPGPRPEHGRSTAHWAWEKAAGEHRPKWTVAGAVAGPQRAIAWLVRDAQYFGLAQRRRRVFVVAGAGAGFDPAAILLEFDGVRRDSPPVRGTGQDVTGTLDARTSGGGFPGSDGAANGHVVPVAYSGGNRGPSGLTIFAKDVCPTLRAGGNLTGGDRPPGTDVDTADSLVVCMAHGQAGAEIAIGRAPTLTCNHEAPIACYDPIPFDTTQITSPGNYSVPRAGDPCHPLAAGAHPPAIAFDTYNHSVSDVSATLRAGTGTFGDAIPAVCIDAAEPCGFQSSQSGTRINETAGTLDANYGPRRHNGVLYPDMAVRRLMPVECERLQGFPDNWTLVPTGPKRKPAADGPRYKQLGNSMAVNVMHWIGGRIDAWLQQHAAPIGHNFFDEVLG